MSKWIYTDDRGCIMGINNNDMTGNTGWQQEDKVTLTVDDRLTDEKGAALYKLVKGKAVERTEEERMADWPEEPEPTPSMPEQIAAIQASIDYIAMMTDVDLEEV